MAGQPPTIDLTSASPSHDGIEDITPRVPTSMADTFRETASIARASPAPTTPPHLRQACQQAPPATADEEACPICLTAISYNGIGPTSRFRWPHCNHCFSHRLCSPHGRRATQASLPNLSPTMDQHFRLALLSPMSAPWGGTPASDPTSGYSQCSFATASSTHTHFATLLSTALSGGPPAP